MALEIERRFLLRAIPAMADSAHWHTLRQGYLAIDAVNEVRLRAEAGSGYTMTIKNGSGVAREEVDIPLDVAQFERLWPLSAGRQLEKRRMILPWSNATLFIDEYLKPMHFLLAEVEFTSEEDAAAFQIPDFFGPDVTDIATMRTFPALIERVKAWKAAQ